MRCANGLAVAATVLSAALLPGVASAATIGLPYVRTDMSEPTRGFPSQPVLIYQLRFTAESGEANDVHFAVNSTSGGFSVDSSGAPLTVGENCTNRPGGADCKQPDSVGIFKRTETIAFDLGDGNDKFDSSWYATVAGGPGNDEIVGWGTFDGGPGADLMAATQEGSAGVSYESHTGPVSVTLDGVVNDGEAGEGDEVRDITSVVGGHGNDTLTAGEDLVTFRGGPGNDTLTGSDSSGPHGFGGDYLTGGEGDDFLNARGGNDHVFDEPGADVYLGGDGYETLWYSRKTPVRVSLDGRADDGGAGEGDNVMPDVEEAAGGEADDVLVGNDSANRLIGGGGNNVLLGVGGDDELVGGGGVNELDGGGGKDTIESQGPWDGISARDGTPDMLSCFNALQQQVIVADRVDLGPRPTGCHMFPMLPAPRRVRMSSHGLVPVTVDCPPMAPGGSCLALLLTDGNKTVGTRRLRTSDGDGKRLHIRLPLRIRREVRARGKKALSASVTLRHAGPAAVEQRFSRRLTVLPPKKR